MEPQRQRLLLHDAIDAGHGDTQRRSNWRHASRTPGGRARMADRYSTGSAIKPQARSSVASGNPRQALDGSQVGNARETQRLRSVEAVFAARNPAGSVPTKPDAR